MEKPFRKKWHKLFFLDYRFFIKRNPLFELCPNCKSKASLERLLEPTRIHRFPRFFGLREYHCIKCKWDGYIYLFMWTTNLKRVFLNYLITLFLLYLLYLSLLFLFGDILRLIYS